MSPRLRHDHAIARDLFALAGDEYRVIPARRSDPMRHPQMYPFLISPRSPFRKRDRARRIVGWRGSFRPAGILNLRIFLRPTSS
jgi:hypothetical protein